MCLPIPYLPIPTQNNKTHNKVDIHIRLEDSKEKRQNIMEANMLMKENRGENITRNVAMFFFVCSDIINVKPILVIFFFLCSNFDHLY